MNQIAKASLVVMVLSFSAGAAWFSRPQTATTAGAATAMASAAKKFITGLTPERKTKAALTFDGKERQDWSFVPGNHHGLTFADMGDADKSAARDLIRSGLSARGVLKAEAIMALDAILHDLENGNPSRDPFKYTVAVFGTPGDTGAWAWHLEGHHISLNFTCLKGEVISVTPYFLGANPAEVRGGPSAGKRALAAEEDLGRDLVKSLTPDQRAKAVIADKAPPEVLSLPGRPINGLWPEPPLGLACADLSPDQRRIFDELLAEFTHNLRGSLADAEYAKMKAAGLEKIRFCWAGSFEKNQGHYYRIVGPTFVIEYDNTQNEANHPHTIWHDRTRDFGGDALAGHLKADHAK